MSQVPFQGAAGRRRATLPLVVLLTAALASQACVSARPWRDCPAPCRGKQLEQASAVLVYTDDGTRLWLEDANGSFLAGEGHIEKKALGEVKLYADVICAVHTRRVEPGRLAANLLLVPLAFVGEVVLVVTDLGPTDWDFPVEPLPTPCAHR